MLDGTGLANALITESSIDDAVRAYENRMMPRSAQAAEDCRGTRPPHSPTDS
ncbi:hypothetical protein OG530_01910 [Streptomyces decoyicus]